MSKARLLHGILCSPLRGALVKRLVASPGRLGLAMRAFEDCAVTLQERSHELLRALQAAGTSVTPTVGAEVRALASCVSSAHTARPSASNLRRRAQLCFLQCGAPRAVRLSHQWAVSCRRAASVPQSKAASMPLTSSWSL